MELDITTLPSDLDKASLVGRVWANGGPAVVTVHGGNILDLTALYPTMADLINDPSKLTSGIQGGLPVICSVEELLQNSVEASRDPAKPWLLAPVDLQAIKACGVTFVRSMLERVIEEQADGVPERAAALRAEMGSAIGAELSNIVPGSDAAKAIKTTLSEKGMWSQYLEVGLGPDAEVFTKAQPLSAVGAGADIGIHPSSSWNNPEPELVMIVDADAKIVGVTLGNDVNLRDVEGRSALLLGRAKDNNGSCAIGPFIRLLDEDYTLDDARKSVIGLTVSGEDGFILDGESNAAEISRDVADLVAQAFDCHQYPDGAALFTGTMFTPIKDRGAEGDGFTHHTGDVVTIFSDRLGALTNRVLPSDQVAPWTFGIRALMSNLRERGLI